LVPFILVASVVAVIVGDQIQSGRVALYNRM